MKIHSLEIIDYPPIQHLKLVNLGSTVIIAGANGSGKTRLKQAIIETLQGSPKMNMRVGATRKEESDEKYFHAEFIDVEKGKINAVLNNYINSRKYGGGNYVGSLVQIDSHRDIQTFKYQPVNWLGLDPDDNETPNQFYFQQFPSRWQDFMNYIHQKSAVRDKHLAEELKKNPKDGEKIINNNPDPLEKYKELFHQLLPDKELHNIDPAQPKEFFYKNNAGAILPFKSLSSGEQEVVKVIFDIARKDIKHSIIIFDEPELHLHPTLTLKLIETLKTMGDHTNQLIFLTHSADLISTYYSTGDVYFIDANQSGTNQAHRLSDLNSTHKDLVKLIGENLGLFAVGKKLIFIEGKNSSIDRLTYHTIAQKYLPDAKIIPVGSVDNIILLNSIEQQIRNSIFGIELYMVRDRDGLSPELINKIEKHGRIKCLKRRHIENYFFDTEILYMVAKKLYYTSTNPNLTKESIDIALKNIAYATFNYSLLKNIKEYLSLNSHLSIPTVKAIDGKTTESIKAELVKEVGISLSGLHTTLEEIKITKWIDEEEIRLKKSLDTDEWKIEFQGKVIFSKLCEEVFKDDEIRIRQAYVDIALEENPEIFRDIIDIFNCFK